MRTALFLGTLLPVLVTATAVRAQVCTAAPPTMHVIAATYATAPFTGDSVVNGTQAEVGASYSRAITSASLVGKGNFVLVEGTLLNGRLSIRDVPLGQADGPYLRMAGSATVATELSSLFKGLMLCGYAGVGSTQYTGRYAPTRWLDVPIGIGVGLRLPIGGAVMTPYVFPTFGFYSAFYRAAASYGRPTSFADQGMDMAMNVGSSFLFGRLEIRGTMRMKDWRLQGNNQLQMRAGVWF